jgi:hypothetical protein
MTVPVASTITHIPNDEAELLISVKTPELAFCETWIGVYSSAPITKLKPKMTTAEITYQNFFITRSSFVIKPL